jgi:hypothetical protein
MYREINCSVGKNRVMVGGSVMSMQVFRKIQTSRPGVGVYVILLVFLLQQEQILGRLLLL